ncbi:MAG TPA: DUF1990 domain-containing protein [Myxococcales bacterium]|nr:DUF1990 domain-containing protein [Deltaproteobacteria bacterium]MBU49900.1 DUF1990 domain-containing protein [Deltaproteobacteria bacterium]HAA55342.1 DUF1990 domain-containing protein [Myxococcales bacterium]|tara:strand:- start:10260 stop:10853 length:594 start_codon:yes stop_codon:yes gene_type:complete
MFSLRKPTREIINNYLEEQSKKPFSYAETGALQTGYPKGYVHVNRSVLLGKGEQTFLKGKEAITHWKMNDLGWVYPSPESSFPIEVGQVFATQTWSLGLWLLNPGKILYVIDESDEQQARYGFGFGTLPGHPMSGEECFLVTWDKQTDEVQYSLRSFSFPKHLLSFLGYPYVFLMQKRFGRDSLRKMQEYCRSLEKK